MKVLNNLVILTAILLSSLIMPAKSFYNHEQQKKTKVGDHSNQVSRNRNYYISKEGWKYRVEKATCICAVGLPTLKQQQAAEKECRDLMEKKIRQEDHKMCTLIKILPTRKRHLYKGETYQDEEKEIFRGHIFDRFGVGEDIEERAKTIYIRPMHFHPSFLQTKNKGLIAPMNVNDAQHLVSTIPGFSLDLSMIQTEDSFYHPLPTTHTPPAGLERDGSRIPPGHERNVVALSMPPAQQLENSNLQDIDGTFCSIPVANKQSRNPLSSITNLGSACRQSRSKETVALVESSHQTPRNHVLEQDEQNEQESVSMQFENSQYVEDSFIHTQSPDFTHTTIQNPQLEDEEPGLSATVLFADSAPPQLETECEGAQQLNPIKRLYQFTKSVLGLETKIDGDKFKIFQKLQYGKKKGEGKTNHYRLKHVVSLIADASTLAIWPSYSREERIKALIHQLRLLVDEDGVTEEAIISQTGVELCNFIAAKDTPMKRRPYLSFLRKGGATRNKAINIISKDISNHEWSLVGQHCKYPGAGEPIKRTHKIRRQRIDMSKINTMFDFMHDRNFLEGTSFGIKNVETCNGKMKQIESVKRTVSVSEAYREYIKAMTTALNPDNEEDTWDSINEDDDEDDGGEHEGEYLQSMINNKLLFPSLIHLPITCLFTTEHNSRGTDEGETLAGVKDAGRSEGKADGSELGSAEGEVDDPGEFIDPGNPLLCTFITDECNATCAESGSQCMKLKNHTGSHKYLLPGAISKSLFTKLCNSLTDGQIKNLAGLDNTDVIKGHENFQEMGLIVDRLVEIGQFQPAEYEGLKQQITDMKVYHKTYFIDHLESNLSHSCACIKCGFHDEKDDPIKCKHREEKSHLPPCKKCNECFDSIAALYKLHEKVSASTTFTGIQEDILCNLEAKIGVCKINLEEYRAHVAQKFWESAEEKEFWSKLKPGEAAVISDWKMKILASYFRENMSKFFGKKGFSLIGFMIVYGSDSPTKEVQYVFMLTDDTCQDVQSVMAAKLLLYTEILPFEDVTKVHFRSDGAACFAHKVHKASMPLWKEWTGGKIDEISFKISVAGCGKTNLDGLFGVMTHMILAILRKGHSFESGKALYELLADNPMQSSSFVYYAPDRSISHQVGKGDDGKEQLLKGLQKQYHLLKTTDGESINCYRHSYLGEGTLFPINEINDAVVHVPLSEGSYIKEGGDTEEDTAIPVIEEEESDDIENNPPRYFLIDSTYERINNIKKSTQYSESFQKRKLRKEKDRHDKKNERVEAAEAKERKEMEERGLYCCSVTNMHGDYCTSRYTTTASLDKHESGHSHQFPGVDSTTAALRAYTDASKTGVKFGIGTRANLCDAVRSKTRLSDDPNVAPLLHPSMDAYFKNPGCYNTRRKQNSKHSIALKKDLERMYQQGENGGQKYSTEAAFIEIEKMTVDGRLKYTSDKNNPNGQCPQKDQIKQWFATRKSNGAPNLTMSVDMLKTKCTQLNLPVNLKGMLVKILEFDDLLLGKFEDGKYELTTNKKLEKEIQSRMKGDGSVKGKAIYTLLLEKYDEVEEKRIASGGAEALHVPLTIL